MEPEARRAFEILEELHQSLTWSEIESLLQRIDENRWHLASDFKLSIHKIASLETLCCHRVIQVRPEVIAFIDGKTGHGATVLALSA